MTVTTRTAHHWVHLDGEGDDASIDAFELFSARRALKLLKHRLGRERLLDLLHEEIGAGNAFLREQVQVAAGEETTGTTTLRAHGIGAAQFTSWLGRAFGREDVLLAAHPEHYSIHHAPGRDVNIVETLGDYVCSFYMRPWDAAVAARAEPTPPAGATNIRRSHILLDDGTVVGSVSTAFEEDGPAGLIAVLSVTLPSSCGALVEQHLEHFAVEFRSWILLAAAELATETASQTPHAGSG